MRRRALLGAFAVVLVLPAARACATAQAAGGGHRPAPGRPGDATGVSAALSAAERYWGGAPCGGTVAVRWRADTPRSPLHGTVVEAWATFDTPLGADDFAASPATYTSCAVNVSRARWPHGVPAGAYPAFCQMMVHELGHLMGWPDSLAYPRSDIRYPVLSAANMPRVCVREPLRGVHLRSSFETGGGRRAARGRHACVSRRGRGSRSRCPHP